MARFRHVGADVTKAVVAVPAYFDERQRAATRCGRDPSLDWRNPLALMGIAWLGVRGEGIRAWSAPRPRLLLDAVPSVLRLPWALRRIASLRACKGLG